MTFSCWR